MAALHRTALALAALLACGGTDDPATPPGSDPDTALLPLGDEPSAPVFASFGDGAGFSTDRVFDADREVVRFDTANGRMIADASGDAVSGWMVSGEDLRWTRSGVEFQVRFGTEAGERRAYFTETAAGTLCNLRLTGPEALTIFGTSERPPGP